MTTLTEGRHTAEFIKSEAMGLRSRETVVLASGQKVVPGTPVGKLTAGGKYHPYDQDATDGTQNAAGIAYAAVDASATGTNADTNMVIVARDAEVFGERLEWPTDITKAERTAAEAKLEALGIIIR